MDPIFFVDSKIIQETYSNGTIKTTFTYVTQDADEVLIIIATIKFHYRPTFEINEWLRNIPFGDYTHHRSIYGATR
mgnify:CR=1 FL=1